MDAAYENGYNPFTTGCQIIIADGLKGTDEAYVPVPNGEYVKEAKVGQALMDADIIIDLSHFKGHEMTGFGGGAIKNIAWVAVLVLVKWKCTVMVNLLLMRKNA